MNTVTPATYEATIKAHYAAVQARLRKPAAPPRKPIVIPPIRHRFVAAPASQPHQDRPAWPAQPPAVFYDHCQPSTPARTAADVIRDACQKHGVSRQALLGFSRNPSLCAARHEAAFRMVVELGFSLSQAGRQLGKRDHTTILHSVKRHAASSPAAAMAYRAFRSGAADDDLRSQVVHLHFTDGMSANAIRKRLPLSREKILKWLLDEAESKKDKAA